MGELNIRGSLYWMCSLPFVLEIPSVVIRLRLLLATWELGLGKVLDIIENPTRSYSFV